MKSTGIVRKVDELGRIVLPIELRRVLAIAEKDPIEIFVEDDKIILKKYVSSEIKTEQHEAVKQLEELHAVANNEKAKKIIENAIRLLK